MATFTRQVEVNAIQFTGRNWKAVQDFVGSRSLDPVGKYQIPLFDEADTWLPERGDRDYQAVLSINGMWVPVHENSWVMHDDSGSLTVLSEQEFQDAYGDFSEQPVSAKKATKRTTRKKSS